LERSDDGLARSHEQTTLAAAAAARMIRSSLGGMLSPIKELPLKERAAERGEDDEYEEEEVVEEDEEEEDDEEQLLAAADALGRRMHSASFQMMPVRAACGCLLAASDVSVMRAPLSPPVSQLC